MQQRLTISLRVAWWLRWYLQGVSVASMLTGLDPDWRKVERVVGKAIKVEAH